MFDVSTFPSIFSLRDNLSVEASAFTRAVFRLVGNEQTIRDCWEELHAAEMPGRGIKATKQMLRVHYRQYHRGPRVVKFYFFVNQQDGDRSEWVCVGDTGPRSHIIAPQVGDPDIRWY